MKPGTISLQQVTRRQWWILTGSVFAALALLRLLWTFIFIPGAYAPAQNGELDLRQWNPQNGQRITLDGEWLFYPHMLLPEASGAKSGSEAESASPILVHVPGELNPAPGSEPSSPYGYGSYRLRILLNPAEKGVYAIRVSSVKSASAVYVNGRLAAQSGEPAASKTAYTPRSVSYSATIVPDRNGVVDLVIQVANYDHRKGLGIVRSIHFGSERTIAKANKLSETMQQIVFVIFILHALYAALLYWMGFKDRRLLYLAYFLFAFTLMMAQSADKLLLVWLPIDYAWDYKLKVFLMVTGSYTLLQSLEDAMPAFWRGAAKGPIRLGFALLTLPVFAPLDFLLRVEVVYTLLVSVASLTALVISIRSQAGRFAKDVHLSIMSIALFHVAVWTIVYHFLNISLPFYPVDLLIAVLALSVSWFKKYLLAMEQSRNLQSELQEADRRKDEFLANTSHELRNPLHGILSLSQGVLDRQRNGMDDQSVQDLELVQSIGRQMSHMLGDLLDAMRLKENGIQLSMQRLSLRYVVDNVIEMLQFMLRGKSVVLLNEIDPECPYVEADENRLMQILFNLLHNAIKFTMEGAVSIKAEAHHGGVTVIVADSGIGMDESFLMRLFEPYEQAEASASFGNGGFGLGLRISKQLVELHGGTLSVKSKLGSGTTFRFTLRTAASLPPLQLPPERWRDEASAAAEELASAQAGIHRDGTAILVVDDDPVNLMALENMLGSSYVIVKATTAREALEKLNERTWDLVIADVMMPMLSGYELTMLIRERFNIYSLPILLLTARGRPEDIEAGLLSGANDYVVKPVNAIELRARVRALTGLRKLVGQRLNIEAAWLQAQIKPHFVLNTLTAVAALSEIDNQRMRSLIHDFSNYLRASFNIRNSEEKVSLKNELDLIRCYLNVEQERFGNRLTVVWEVDEPIPIKLPPLLIQPLVENAVVHGVLKKNAGGTVTVRITGTKNRVDVAVIDDGLGMQEDKIQLLLHGGGDLQTGIGLWNTHMRLKQNYGTGLVIRSRTGHGTAVSFSVETNEQIK